MVTYHYLNCIIYDLIKHINKNGIYCDLPLRESFKKLCTGISGHHVSLKSFLRSTELHLRQYIALNISGAVLSIGREGKGEWPSGTIFWLPQPSEHSSIKLKRSIIFLVVHFLKRFFYKLKWIKNWISLYRLRSFIYNTKFR